MPDKQLPFDLANVPDGYWERATNPGRLRDLKTSGSRDVVPLPPHMIRIDPTHNPRDYRLPENRAHLDALAISVIKKHGKEGARMILEKKVEEAKAAGKKKAARDTKAPKNPVKDAAFSLCKSLEDSDVTDLDNTDVEYISVDRKKVKALFRAVYPDGRK